MKTSTLYNKMKAAGYGYTKCSREVSKLSGIDIWHYDLFNFVHRNFKRLGKNRKKIIRAYFISKGWLSKPKPRKAPVCRNCGLEYPTRKVSSFASAHKPESVTK